MFSDLMANAMCSGPLDTTWARDEMACSRVTQVYPSMWLDRTPSPGISSPFREFPMGRASQTNADTVMVKTTIAATTWCTFVRFRGRAVKPAP